jgi:maltose O-acetyltransferase
MKYELQMWIAHFVSFIPGNIGCWLRCKLLPCKFGPGTKIWNSVHIDKPSKLVLGASVSINRGCIIHAGGGVSIGDDTLIGPGVVIYSQNHCFSDPSVLIRNQGYETKEVTIGKNVWIASRAIILPGVTIGDGAVIGAGSVVTKNVIPRGLVAGSPAKLMRKIDDH